MTVYIVMIEDRHTDPQAYVFSTAERAIAYAKRAAEENATDPEDIEEQAVKDWLYYAVYSVEGDSVWVIARVLDEEPAA